MSALQEFQRTVYEINAKAGANKWMVTPVVNFHPDRGPADYFIIWALEDHGATAILAYKGPEGSTRKMLAKELDRVVKPNPKYRALDGRESTILTMLSLTPLNLLEDEKEGILSELKDLSLEIGMAILAVRKDEKPEGDPDLIEGAKAFIDQAGLAFVKGYKRKYTKEPVR